MKSLPITPVILTFNEGPNVGRTLEALRWATRVVIVDSGSSDETEAIARSYANVAWHERRFDCHARQWSYAIQETGIDTPWALALDADMQVSSDFVLELEQRFLNESYAGGIVPFIYCTSGRKLLGSLYPPDLRIFPPSQVAIRQVGHTQRFSITGETYRFASPVLHDDRKPLRHWLAGQVNYSELEVQRMAQSDSRGLKYTLRRAGISPLVAGTVGYIRAGGPFRGRAALQYAYERMTFESILSMQLLRERLNPEVCPTQTNQLEPDTHAHPGT